jgi:hypothetical protein
MDQLQFLEILDKSLSEFEVGRLSRQFGIDYYVLPGASKRDRLREFLGIIGRQTRLEGLAEATVALRPDIAGDVAQLFYDDDADLAWLDMIAHGDKETVDSGVTWRWSMKSDLELPPSSAGAAEYPINESIDLTKQTLPEAKTRSFRRRKDSVEELSEMVRPVNPYTPGRPITDSKMFFGRKAELEWMHSYLLNGDHVAIIGPRTFGGSSLIYYLAHHVEVENSNETARILPAYVDMKNAEHHSVPGLLDGIWRQWWEIVRPGQAVRTETLAEFVTGVRKLHAAGFRPILFLDEFDQLVWQAELFGEHIFNAWYELGLERLLQIICTTHSPPADLLAQINAESEIYEMFQQIDIGLLDHESARALLTIPVERAGITLPNDAVDELLSLAGPHPFFLHLAGLYLYDSLTRQEYSFEQVAEQFIIAATPYWQELWDSLSPLAQQHFPVEDTNKFAESDLAQPEAAMSMRQLRILVNRGLVIQNDRGYQPFSSGFGQHLRRIRSAGEAVSLISAGLRQA